MITIDPIGPDELETYVRVAETAFGHHADEGDVDEIRAIVEYDRTLAAREEGRIVGTAAALSEEITLPGRRTVPVAAVTEVTVLPTHRRRGIMRSLMERQLEDVAGRGEHLCALTAAEGGIYRRFGYGPAVMAMACEVRREGSAFDPGLAPRGVGAVRLVGSDEAALVLPDLFDRYRRGRPGEISRSRGMWEAILADRERWREGASAFFFAIHDGAIHDGAGGNAAGGNAAGGYAAYRVREQWTNGLPWHSLEVTEVVAASDAAYRQLWRYLLDVDLVGSVSAWNVPADSHLRWLLADPRQLRTTSTVDFLWIRILDVAAALEARAYACDGSVVLEIVDELRPESGGRYRLEGGPDGAVCSRTDDAADLVLPTDALASAYLGGVSLAGQALAGRVDAFSPGALMRVDAMLSCHPGPSCVTDF